MSEYTTTPTWSESPWSTKNTSKGEGLLQQRLKGSPNYDNVRVAHHLVVGQKMSCYLPLIEYGPVTRFIRTRTVEIFKFRGQKFILCDCYRYNRTKIACEHVINILESLGANLSVYHFAGIRWSTAYLINYGAPDISEELRDAFERSLQHPGVPFHPSTNVDGPTPVGSTINDFCPCSLHIRPLSATARVDSKSPHQWLPWALTSLK
jgi:hypothetical protein